MIDLSGIVALDGHDGSGKTTLARAVASAVGGRYGRPFGGHLGKELLRAGEDGDAETVVRSAQEGIRSAVEASDGVRPVVLDRAWMTAASLVDWNAFRGRWQWWVPTVLCWVDVETTLARVASRTERQMARSWHERYLARYLELARRTNSYVLRTDRHDVDACVELLRRWACAPHETDIARDDACGELRLLC